MNPEDGAGLLIITVPVVVAPPTKEVGLIENPVKVGGVIVSDTPIELGEAVAVILAIVCVEVDFVVIVNVAEVAPPATTTLAGTTAEEELEESETLKPPEGAAVPSITVPIDDAPPRTVVGARLKAVRVGGFTVRTAVAFDPPRMAVMVVDVLLATGNVFIVKFAVILPLVTKTVWGKLTAKFEDVKATVAPEFPAWAESVTVPATEDPP